MVELGKKTAEFWLANNMDNLPTCNNCRYQDGCCYVPEKGQMVRINCIAHGWNEESLARMMPERAVNT